MTTNYFTEISVGAAANAATFNSPMGELDAALTAINDGFTIAGQSQITHGWTGAKATNDYQLIIINTNEDASGPDDYQNEVHLRLKAGTSANHRRYIDFFNYDNSQAWLMGVNATDTFIVYSTQRASHFIWAENDGDTYINADGAKAVIVNYHPTDTTGTSGFRVYDGQPAGTMLFSVAPTSGIDSTINVYMNAGSSSAQNLNFLWQSQGTSKWGLNKNDSEYFALYDYANSWYALRSYGKQVSIGTSTLNATLRVEQAATDGAMAVLRLKQADVDFQFMTFEGEAASADRGRNLIAVADGSPTLVGWYEIYVDDAGNQITDGNYYVPFYSIAAP